jgi:nitrile hydratase
MGAARFAVGAAVRIRRAFPPGHVRAPFYLRGCNGAVSHIVGEMGNPEELAYGRGDAPRVMVYRVRVRQTDIWDDYAGPARDTLIVDVFENWLEPAEGDTA